MSGSEIMVRLIHG